MDAVLFDMDDTIYDQAQPFANAVRKVLGILPATPDEFYRASRRHSGEVFAAYGAGDSPTDAMYVRRMRQTMADFGIDISDDVARRMQSVYVSRDEDAMSLEPAMASALAWCRAHTSRGVGIVTNGTAGRQLDKCEALGLWRWVRREDIFVSDELGVAKPDPRIFLQACNAMGARPARSLFVGDSFQIDVVGARRAGIPVIWFNRRHHKVPEGAGSEDGEDVRPDWVVHTADELRKLLESIVC